MQKDNNFRSKEFYEQKLDELNGRMAELLAEGKTIEVDLSRSGIKMYSFRRKPEIPQKGKAEATPNNRK